MSETGIEIVTGRHRRRRWSVEDKLRIVAATHELGACMKQVAASHDIYPGLLFTWRRQVREGTLAPAAMPVFLQVRASSSGLVSSSAPTSSRATPSRATGQIEVELKEGSRVRFDASVGLSSLRRVIAALRG